MIKKLFASLTIALSLVGGASAAGGALHLDKFPTERLQDEAALQRGAKLFVNYCLNCHAAAFMRYNRMRDIGLTEEQIKANLLFASEKVGDLMTVAISAKDSKEWFGATPPDLTVIARSRASHYGTGADYLYTYLRGFYRDETRPTGWNNTVFPAVGMPHVLWELQGEQRLVGEPGHGKLEVTKPGVMSTKEYDEAIADLVAYLQWMGEPGQFQRAKLGSVVLIFLAGFMFLAWRLNKTYWKDIK